MIASNSALLSFNFTGNFIPDSKPQGCLLLHVRVRACVCMCIRVDKKREADEGGGGKDGIYLFFQIFSVLVGIKIIKLRYTLTNSQGG